MALLDITLDVIQKEFEKDPPIWITAQWTAKNKQFIINECKNPVEFDPTNTRQKLIQNIDNSTVITCPYGTLHVIYDNEQQKTEIPWTLWARILRLYSHKGKPFTIFFLASPHIRQFPANSNPITPLHINGGYTYPCNHETIVIYRAEDATRVLIHELQHSCCLDHQELGVDQTEAETEAWAELIYCALLSQGNKPQFHILLKEQSAWILSQNKRVQEFNGKSHAFPWRYTVGKEDVWRRWNILKSAPIIYTNSLRLTMLPKQVIKRLFGVSKESTIL